MSLAVRLDTGEEMDGVEVGENVLDGWKSVGEGFFDGLVDCMGVVERCEEGVRKHVADGEGELRFSGNKLVRRWERACVRHVR